MAGSKLARSLLAGRIRLSSILITVVFFATLVVYLLVRPVPASIAHNDPAHNNPALVPTPSVHPSRSATPSVVPSPSASVTASPSASSPRPSIAACAPAASGPAPLPNGCR